MVHISAECEVRPRGAYPPSRRAGRPFVRRLVRLTRPGRTPTGAVPCVLSEGAVSLGRVEEAGGQPLLNHRPPPGFVDGVHDAAIPAVDAALPGEQEAGEATVGAL